MPNAAIRRQVLRPHRGGGGSAFTSLEEYFASSEPGAFWDFTDDTMVFTDLAETTNMDGQADGTVARSVQASAGQSISLQRTGTSTITRQTDGSGTRFLEWDGTTSNALFTNTGTLDMTGSDEVTIMVGCYSDTVSATPRTIVQHGAFSTNKFWMFFPTSLNAMSAAVRGSSGTGSLTTSVSASTLYLFTATGKISSDLSTLYQDGASVDTVSEEMGSGNFLNQTLYVGLDGAASFSRFDGGIYFVFIRGALTSGVDLVRLHELGAAKLGGAYGGLS